MALTNGDAQEGEEEDEDGEEQSPDPEEFSRSPLSPEQLAFQERAL